MTNSLAFATRNSAIAYAKMETNQTHRKHTVVSTFYHNAECAKVKCYGVILDTKSRKVK